MKPRRKLQTVKSRPLRRKGNHPSNPYAAEAETAPRHEDRAGWPFPARKDDLSDEAQLGGGVSAVRPAVIGAAGEPCFILRAADPLSGMILRFWANANERTLPYEAAEAHMLAARMDAWREGIAARRRDGRAGAAPANEKGDPA